MTFRSFLLSAGLLLPATLSAAAAPAAIWICSTEETPARVMPAPALEPARPEAPPAVRVATDKTRQLIDGFGGCFNELGWQAMAKLPPAARAEILTRLFGDEGAAFTLARLPIGASDFALDGYSLADTPDDFALRHFSIERDRRHLIPFVRAAQSVRPDLRFWASPWSPPAWMKTNSSYSRGSLRWEPEILRTYANYFVRWVEAYRAEGIPIYALTPQNEPNILNVYPTCLWTGPQLREFIADHLGPTLRDRKIDVELWLGLNGDPLNQGDNANARLVTVLEDPRANAFLTGIAFQYDSRNQIATARELYTDKKLMQSETECHRGDNSWSDALQLYAAMKRYLDGGASAYFAWNMVLDETGNSTWNWKQNALVTVHRDSGQVVYNGEYHVLRHFSGFIKPGARRVLTTGVWGDQIAFLNRDGSVVAVVANSSGQAHAFSLAVGGRGAADTVRVELPARSVNTFVVPVASGS